MIHHLLSRPTLIPQGKRSLCAEINYIDTHTFIDHFSVSLDLASRLRFSSRWMPKIGCYCWKQNFRKVPLALTHPFDLRQHTHAYTHNVGFTRPHTHTDIGFSCGHSIMIFCTNCNPSPNHTHYRKLYIINIIT